MRGRTTTDRQPRIPQDDTLARLLTAEEGLAARLDAARAEAEQTLRAASEDARRIEAACDATIAARHAELNAEHTARVEEALATITDEAARTEAGFEAIDAARTRELIALVIARLLPQNQDLAERAP